MKNVFFLWLLVTLVLVTCGQNPTPVAQQQTTSPKSGPVDQVAFFLEECEQNNVPLACYMLGVRYLKGDGVPQDQNKGRRLIQKACNGGVPVACKLLQ